MSVLLKNNNWIRSIIHEADTTVDTMTKPVQKIVNATWKSTFYIMFWYIVSTMFNPFCNSHLGHVHIG